MWTVEKSGDSTSATVNGVVVRCRKSETGELLKAWHSEDFHLDGVRIRVIREHWEGRMHGWIEHKQTCRMTKEYERCRNLQERSHSLLDGDSGFTRP